jgi:hypothetical protein
MGRRGYPAADIGRSDGKRLPRERSRISTCLNPQRRLLKPVSVGEYVCLMVVARVRMFTMSVIRLAETQAL